MEQWYINQGDRVVGPGTGEQLVKAFNEGSIKDDTLVSRFAEGPWTPLKMAGILPVESTNPFLSPDLEHGLDKTTNQIAGHHSQGDHSDEQISGRSSFAGDLQQFFHGHPVYGKSIHVASWLERAIAILIDLTVLFGVNMLVYAAFSVTLIVITTITTALAIFTKSPILILSTVALVVPLFLGFFTPFLYYVVLQHRWGWTVGRKVMKMHVELRDGSRPSLVKFIVRYFSSMLSSSILGIGYLLALNDGKVRTLHDRIAGTIVVKDVS